MNNKKIDSLYERFKNNPNKLKIICDWDEVIQATEPYCLWLAKPDPSFLPSGTMDNFNNFFKGF